MIQPESLSQFIEASSALHLDDTASAELGSFIDRLVGRSLSTIPEIQKAFQELRMLFRKETTTQFPTLIKLISELEEDTIALVMSRTLSPKHGKPHEHPSTIDFSVGDTVGQESSLDLIRDTFDPHQNACIDVLDALHIRCRSIRGDGHCAFRAIATWVLSSLDVKIISERIHTAAKQISAEARLKSIAAQRVCDNAADALKSLHTTGKITKAQSDDFVQFLRVVAVYTVLQDIDKGSLILDNETQETYIHRMVDMRGAPEGHGEEQEIAALMKAFASSYRIVNFTSLTYPAGLGGKHLRTFVEGEGNKSFLVAASNELRRVRRSEFAREVDSLKSLPIVEAQQRGKEVLGKIEAFNQELRARHIQMTKEDLQSIGPNTLILGFVGNGHYHLLIMPEAKQEPSSKKSKKDV